MSDVNRELLYAGKAKDIYKSENENEVIIKFRDDITAGDGEKKDTLSKKGFCNVLISAKLFKVLEENGIINVTTNYLIKWQGVSSKK